MAETTKARTARKAHFCQNCHWFADRRGVHTIAPGHRYLIHTAFPGYDYIELKTPVSAAECVACAIERGQEHETGACQTFCCGDVPCARPDRHDGDHSCRRCAVTA